LKSALLVLTTRSFSADSEENVIAERARIGALISAKSDGLIVIPCHDDSPSSKISEERRYRQFLWIVRPTGTIFDSVMADNCLSAVKGRAICFPLDTAILCYWRARPVCATFKNALRISRSFERSGHFRSREYRGRRSERNRLCQTSA